MAFAERLKADTQSVRPQTVRAVPPTGEKLAGTRDVRHLTTVLLADGLSGKAEKLVADLYDRAQGGAQIVGGAAGDEGKFKTTHVGDGENASSDAAAAMHVFSATPWGVGVNHGLRSTTKQMRVTRATATSSASWTESLPSWLTRATPGLAVSSSLARTLRAI